jgi:hypothetical protein
MNFLVGLLFLAATGSLAIEIAFGALWSEPLKIMVFAQAISLVAGAAAIF